MTKKQLDERVLPIWMFGAGMTSASFGSEKLRGYVGTVGLFIVMVGGLLMFFSLITRKREKPPA